jgi:hypothetical protein
MTTANPMQKPMNVMSRKMFVIPAPYSSFGQGHSHRGRRWLPESGASPSSTSCTI